MRTTALVVLTLALTLGPGLSGCTFHIAGDHGSSHQSVAKQERQARAYIARAQLGTSSSAVLAELGPPEFSDLVRTSQGEVRVLRYRTHRTHADGDTTRDETTPLIFKNDALIGSGELALEVALRD